MELEDIEREKFDRSLAKRQIHQYFPPSINCAIWYVGQAANVADFSHAHTLLNIQTSEPIEELLMF